MILTETILTNWFDNRLAQIPIEIEELSAIASSNFLLLSLSARSTRLQPTQLFCTIKTAAERSEIDMLVRYSLSDYIAAAINTSEIEQLEDGSYVGRIPDCQGVIAFGDTLSECQAELRSTLEDWILVGLKLGHTLPVIAEIDLNREYVCESIDPL